MPQPLSEQLLANMDIHRFLSGFPVWSTAYQNHFSNTSKLLSPLLEPVSQNFNIIDSHYNSFFEVNEFGFSNSLFYTPIFGRPDSVNNDDTTIEYIGEMNSVSLESSNISKVLIDSNITPTEDIQLENIRTLSAPVFMDTPTILYVRSDSHILDQNVAIIRGYNENYIYVEERIVFFSSVPMSTNNKYRVITNISSAQPITVMSKLKLDTYHCIRHSGLLQKRITDVSGAYIEPSFIIEDNNIHVISSSSITRTDVYKFKLNHIPDLMFINNLFDIIYLSNNSLYSSKMKLDYTNLSQENSSVNNNDFILVDDINTSVGETCFVSAKICNVLSEYHSGQVRISVKNQNTKLYLNSNLDLVSDRNTWISISGLQNIIRFGIVIDNDSPYIFNMELNNSQKEFTAMSYSNVLDSILLYEQDEEDEDNNITDITVFNNEVLVELGGSGKYKKITPIRHSYMTHSNYSIVTSNIFDDLDLVYD